MQQLGQIFQTSGLDMMWSLTERTVEEVKLIEFQQTELIKDSQPGLLPASLFPTDSGWVISLE